jgi:hypothetical protein
MAGVKADPDTSAVVITVVNARDAMPDGGKLTTPQYVALMPTTFVPSCVLPGNHVMLQCQ